MATLAAMSRHHSRWDEAKHPRRADGKFGSGGGHTDRAAQRAAITAFVRGRDPSKPAARRPPSRPSTPAAPGRDEATRQRLADFIHGRGPRPTRRDRASLGALARPQRPASKQASGHEDSSKAPLTGDAEISRYLAGHLDGVRYPAREKAATLEYTSSLYTDINFELRGGHDSSRPETIAALDAAFARTPPLTRPIVVTRGIASADEILGPPPATGSVIHDKAYTSTSMSGSAVVDRIGGERDTAVMHITVPAGARVLAFDQPTPPALRSKIPEEREILLDRGYHGEDDEYSGTVGGTTSGIRIVSDTIVDGQRVIHAELIPQEAA